jgi:hypothetical protein
MQTQSTAVCEKTCDRSPRCWMVETKSESNSTQLAGAGQGLVGPLSEVCSPHTLTARPNKEIHFAKANSRLQKLPF